MSETILGRIAPVYQGEYDSTKTYVILDRISYDGNYYECIQDTEAGVAPTDLKHWVILGTMGTDGKIPNHKWDGTKLSFENPDGSYDDGVDLQGPKGEDKTTYPISDSIDSDSSEAYASSNAMKLSIDEIYNQTNLLTSDCPDGTIAIWYGFVDTDGHPCIGDRSYTSWWICNGSNGTPNLRGSYIIGANATYTANTSTSTTSTSTSKSVDGNEYIDTYTEHNSALSVIHKHTFTTLPLIISSFTATVNTIASHCHTPKQLVSEASTPVSWYYNSDASEIYKVPNSLTTTNVTMSSDNITSYYDSGSEHESKYGIFSDVPSVHTHSLISLDNTSTISAYGNCASVYYIMKNSDNTDIDYEIPIKMPDTKTIHIFYETGELFDNADEGTYSWSTNYKSRIIYEWKIMTDTTSTPSGMPLIQLDDNGVMCDVINSYLKMNYKNINLNYGGLVTSGAEVDGIYTPATGDVDFSVSFDWENIIDYNVKSELSQTPLVIFDFLEDVERTSTHYEDVEHYYLIWSIDGHPQTVNFKDKLVWGCRLWYWDASVPSAFQRIGLDFYPDCGISSWILERFTYSTPFFFERKKKTSTYRSEFGLPEHLRLGCQFVDPSGKFPTLHFKKKYLFDIKTHAVSADWFTAYVNGRTVGSGTSVTLTNGDNTYEFTYPLNENWIKPKLKSMGYSSDYADGFAWGYKTGIHIQESTLVES